MGDAAEQGGLVDQRVDGVHVARVAATLVANL
jgi:hypothetical protein